MFEDFPRASVAPAYSGPRGFAWLEPGLLGGCARPGIVSAMTSDLEALVRVGTRVLVSLTEEWEPDAQMIAEYGMQSVYFPIVDRGVPELDEARALSERMMRHLSQGQAVTFHCRAGKGRTGTMLACMLIYRGMAPEDAIAATRQRNPKWIESEEQLDFLRAFSAPALAGTDQA
jgi:atypical dual specificity phosphatase